MIDLKTFDQWNEIKKNLHQKEKEAEFFKEKQIWWCSIGQNLGSESYGKGATFSRPVLIFKKLSQRTFLGIPLTSKTKQGSWYITIRHRSKEITALLNQIRIYDKKRLSNRFGELDDEDFYLIKAKFSAFYCS